MWRRGPVKVYGIGVGIPTVAWMVSRRRAKGEAEGYKITMRVPGR